MGNIHIFLAIFSVLLAGCCGLSGGGGQNTTNESVKNVYASNGTFAIVADPATPAGSLINLTDTNKDGRIDEVTMDTDGDGTADVFLFDRNYDGKVDKWDVTTWNGTVHSYAWDLTGDGIPDVYDSDGNGTPDAWDVNSDGTIDKRDPNNDGKIELNDNNFDGVFDEIAALAKHG